MLTAKGSEKFGEAQNNVSDSKEGLKSLSHDSSKKVVFKSTSKGSEKRGGAQNNVAAP